MRIKNIIISLVTLFSLAGLLAPAAAFADAKSAIQCGVNGAAGASGCNTQPTTSLSDTISNVVNIMSAFVGILAVVMIIVGGFRYVTSAGDTNRLAGAKNTIIYAIIGLIIVAFAQIIVHFVINKSTTPSSGSNSTNNGSSGLTGNGNNTGGLRGD